MTQPTEEVRIVNGGEGQLFYAIAEVEGKEVARERVPIHIMNLPDTSSRKEVYMNQISERLKRRVVTRLRGRRFPIKAGDQ